jgi:hypothetical protein
MDMRAAPLVLALLLLLTGEAYAHGSSRSSNPALDGLILLGGLGVGLWGGWQRRKRKQLDEREAARDIPPSEE